MTDTAETTEGIGNHTDRDHAKKAPSGYERLMKCPGSVMLSLGMPNTSGYAADLGIYAHEIGEACIYNPKTMDQVVERMTNSRNLPDWIKQSDVDDLRVYPKRYAEYVLKVRDRLNPYRFKIEQQVKLTDDIWGTLDIGMAYEVKGKDRIAVIDYKNGTGYSVKAKNNPQIIIYALAFAKMLGIEPEKTTCIIYQPRMFGEKAIRKAEYTWPEMLKWKKKILKASKVADMILDGSVQPTFKVGDWCHFCAARVKCDKYNEDADVAGLINPYQPAPAIRSNQLTDEQIVELLRRERQIFGLFKAMKEYVIYREARYRTEKMGKPVAGTKCVEGQSKRRWSGKLADIVEYMETIGVKNPTEVTEKMRGIGAISTELEKSLDREKFPKAADRKNEVTRLLKPVIEKPAGKVTVTLEEDPRPAVEVSLSGELIPSEDLLDDLE